MSDPSPTPPRERDRRVFLRLLRLARPFAPRLVAASICLLISTGTFLAIPYGIRLLTDSVVIHHDASELNRIAAALIIIVFIAAFFGFLRSYLLAYVGGRIIAELRINLYRHLQSLSLDFYDERRTGDLMSRLAADTTLVQTVLTGSLLSLLQQVVTLVAVVVIVLLVDWRLALVTFGLAPVMGLAGVLVGRRTRDLSMRAQQELGNSSVVVEETLTAMRVVKAFGREPYELGRYSEAINRTFSIGLTAARLRSIFEAGMVTVAFLAIGGVFWFGGHEVLAGRLTPGGLISFIFYMTLLVSPIQSLSVLYGQFQQAAGGATRVFEILDTPPAVVDAPDAYALPPVQGYIEIDHLHFAYKRGTQEVLRDVTLAALPGQRIALVGPSGAGKTTLVSLIPRFYQPALGRIRIDGHDISRVTMSSLRSAMAIVPQEPTLFGGTIRENIAYGRIDAADQDIERAARTANAHDFIMALPHGYQSVVGERGVKLSGGQKQRIAIARAILKNPRILILDEATSSLDNESEALIQDALERLMAGRTTFVIAHRLTTIEEADLIILLHEGQILEQGKHGDLMQQEGLYYRLYTRTFESQQVIPALQGDES